MKRFALSIAILSVSLFTIGCNQGPGVATEEEAAESMDATMNMDVGATPGTEGAAGGADPGAAPAAE